MEKPAKNFGEYQQTKPLQLELFDLHKEGNTNYSQTIELYDFMPKYVLGKVEEMRVDGRFLDSITRTFECRGKEYQIRLLPAKIVGEDGTEKDYFLGVREEIVEDTLRKLAVEGKGVMLDGELGMRFTIHQVRSEVKKNGHTYSYGQVIDALNILATATIQITDNSGADLLPKKNKSKTGKDVLFHPLETLAIDNDAEDTPTFVRFSPLVTKSIQETSFRMINFRHSMKHKSFIARQLYKRMSHHFTQAEISKPYTIKLTTIIRDFGLTVQRRLKSNLENVEVALEEMQDNRAILHYKIEKTWDSSGKRSKLADAVFQLYPSPEFAADARKFNARSVDNRRRLASEVV